MAVLLIRSVIFLRGLLGAENIGKFVFDMFKASLFVISQSCNFSIKCFFEIYEYTTTILLVFNSISNLFSYIN